MGGENGNDDGGKKPGVTPKRSPARAKSKRDYQERVQDIRESADREQAEREAIGQLKSRTQKAKNLLEDPLRAVLDPTARIDATIGTKMRSIIAEDIRLGGKIVRDTKGMVVGSTRKNALGFEVYTGRSEFSPIGRKSGVRRTDFGYNVSAAEARDGGDDRQRATTSAAAPSEPSEPVSAPSTGLSGAAKKSLQAARTAGAARRRFIV